MVITVYSSAESYAEIILVKDIMSSGIVDAKQSLYKESFVPTYSGRPKLYYALYICEMS